MSVNSAWLQPEHERGDGVKHGIVYSWNLLLTQIIETSLSYILCSKM
jgi:hypothetical protein